MIPLLAVFIGAVMAGLGYLGNGIFTYNKRKNSEAPVDRRLLKKRLTLQVVSGSLATTVYGFIIYIISLNM